MKLFITLLFVYFSTSLLAISLDLNEYLEAEKTYRVTSDYNQFQRFQNGKKETAISRDLPNQERLNPSKKREMLSSQLESTFKIPAFRSAFIGSVRRKSKGFYHITELQNLPNIGYYLGPSSFGFDITAHSYREIFKEKKHLLDWTSSIIKNKLGYTDLKTNRSFLEIKYYNQNGKHYGSPESLREIIELFHATGRPIYYFLYEHMSTFCHEEIKILIKNPKLMKNIHFIYGIKPLIDRPGRRPYPYKWEQVEEYLFPIQIRHYFQRENIIKKWFKRIFRKNRI